MTPTDFGAFRVCQHGQAVTYSAMMETTGPQVVSRLVIDALAHGTIQPADAKREHYAVLDLLDETGDILGDFYIPTEDDWQWWLGIAGLHPTATDCPTCEPEAHRATYGRRQ